MATNAVTAPDAAIAAEAEAATGARPYAPSWVDRLDGWIEGLPGPTWVAYLGVAVVTVGASLVQPALAGATDPLVWMTAAFWGVLLPLSLWLSQYLKDVAGSAFDAFRPLLGASDADARRLRYGLTTTPARPALAILIANLIITPLYYLADPEASAVVGLAPPAILLRYVSEVFFGSILITLVFHSLRQLRAVGRIHASADRVDLFRPAPLYAFSVFTSRAAIIIALLFIVPTLVAAAGVPLSSNIGVFVAPWVVAGIVIAGLVFVLPLRGMQRRIIDEKHRLQTAVGGRIEATMEVMHERIDAGDPAGARAQHEVLQALVTERDLVDRLPTLPWRPGTLGAVVSAVVAPLGIFVLTRLLERVI